MRLTLALIFLAISANAFAAMRTYFNGREGVSYTDPYRGVQRNGDNLEAILLQELARAQKSIVVAVQELRLPAIAKILVQKQQAGVEVRVVLENAYNHNVMAQERIPDPEEGESHDSTRYRDLVRLIDVNGDGQITRAEMLDRDAVFILSQNKVPVIDDTVDGSSGSGLMHHKFVVIDNKRVIISSANFTPSCVHGDVGTTASRGNANGLMVIDSVPMARLFAEEFEFFWEGKFGINKPFRGARTVTVGGKKVTVQFSPTSKTVAWDMTTNGLIAKTLASAKKSIQAALFVFSEQKLADAMAVAHKKASVSVLVEAKFAFRPYSELLDLLGVALPDANCVIEANNAPWRPATLLGGQVALPAGDILHHKFGLVDTRKVIFGSHNWSESANTTNDEFLVVIDDVQTAQEFGREHDRLAARARWGLPTRIQDELTRSSERCPNLAL
jgi:phosphatidylserine/phosphatidylglycerophosphate/cardiolipin synthase-like enzyme